MSAYARRLLITILFCSAACNAGDARRQGRTAPSAKEARRADLDFKVASDLALVLVCDVEQYDPQALELVLDERW